MGLIVLIVFFVFFVWCVGASLVALLIDSKYVFIRIKDFKLFCLWPIALFFYLKNSEKINSFLVSHKEERKKLLKSYVNVKGFIEYYKA